MNRAETIASWLADPVIPAKGSAGWTVKFAKLADGTMPALNYLRNQDTGNDASFPVNDKHFGVFAGYFQGVAVSGPLSLNPDTQLIPFKGDDAVDGMCEFRVVTNLGHRMLAFKRGDRTLILACGFRKPARSETPHEAKTRARTIRKAHEAREAEEARKAKRPRQQ